MRQAFEFVIYIAMPSHCAPGAMAGDPLAAACWVVLKKKSKLWLPMCNNLPIQSFEAFYPYTQQR
jgi:hypothetical protein